MDLPLRADRQHLVHAPRLAEPAGDLVSLTGIEPGWRVLDVGTGTGVAAFAAAGAGARVYGIDEAIGMLRVARSANGTFPVATAEAIGLDIDSVPTSVAGVLMRFTKASGCETVVVNDADAAGVAEVRFGHEHATKGVVIMATLGTGIGTGTKTGCCIIGPICPRTCGKGR